MAGWASAMVMPNVRAPMPAVVTVDESVSFGASSSGGAAPRLVVGPVGAAVVATATVVGAVSVVAVAVLNDVTAGVSVGLSSPQPPANKSPAGAAQRTPRRPVAQRGQG